MLNIYLKINICINGTYYYIIMQYAKINRFQNCVRIIIIIITKILTVRIKIEIANSFIADDKNSSSSSLYY